MSERVLAFFGAFNPPTKAHVNLAKLSKEKLNYDRVIFIPSKSSYISETLKKNYVFSDEERLDMLYEVYDANHDWMLFTDHDILSDSQPSRYSTLRWLKDKKGYDPTLLIGADELSYMEERAMKNALEIAKEFGIVVMTKRAFSITSILNSTDFYKSISPYVKIVETPANTRNISSSWIRYNLLDAQEHIRLIKKDLPDGVYEYIKESYISGV